MAAVHFDSSAFDGPGAYPNYIRRTCDDGQLAHSGQVLGCNDCEHDRKRAVRS